MFNTWHMGQWVVWSPFRVPVSNCLWCAIERPMLKFRSGFRRRVRTGVRAIRPYWGWTETRAGRGRERSLSSAWHSCAPTLVARSTNLLPLMQTDIYCSLPFGICRLFFMVVSPLLLSLALVQGRVWADLEWRQGVGSLDYWCGCQGEFSSGVPPTKGGLCVTPARSSTRWMS